MEDSGYGSLIIDNCNTTTSLSLSTSSSLSPNQSLQSSIDSSRKRKCDSGIELDTPNWTGNFSDTDKSEFISPAKRALTDSLASLCKIQSEPNSPQPTATSVQHQQHSEVRQLRKVVSFDYTPSYNPLSIELPKRPQSVLGRKRTRAVTKSKECRQTTIATWIRLRQRHIDFMRIFARETNNINIISEIFSYLTDNDLRTVSKVSRLWRRVLFNDRTAYERYLIAEEKFIVSKENITNTIDTSQTQHQSVTITTRSPPRSPTSEKHNKFVKIAEKLQDMQTLTKCPDCENPAIIEDNIAECTKCIRIWCIRCLRKVSTESENRSLKEISPNTKQPLFFYHSEDSCSSSSSSSNNDDHLIRKYFITSNSNEDQRSSNNNIDQERKIIPKLSIKRALSFSKLSNNNNSNNDKSKCAILSDFSNKMRTRSATTQVPKNSNNNAALLSSTKRKTCSRLHVCHNAANSSSPPASADESSITTSPKDRKTTKQRLRRLCR